VCVCVCMCVCVCVVCACVYVSAGGRKFVGAEQKKQSTFVYMCARGGRDARRGAAGYP